MLDGEISVADFAIEYKSRSDVNHYQETENNHCACDDALYCKWCGMHQKIFPFFEVSRLASM